MSGTDVWITGAGAITAAGPTRADLARALHEGRSCIAPVRLFDTAGLKVHIAGEVDEIPWPATSPGTHHRHSRSDALALHAATAALAESGLDLTTVSPRRIGVSIGTSTGGMLDTERFYEAGLREEPAGPFRRRLLGATVGAPTTVVASHFHSAGPRLTMSTACSSGAIAIALAAGWIRRGRADVVLAGGSDSLTRMTFTGFHSLQAMSPVPCQPFDVDRAGMSLGEGAGVVILESAAHARARGATPLATLAGAGMSCDAHHLTAPHPEARGAIQALRAALRDARTEPAEVGYVNAHGTGTPQNDLAEARAIHDVFGSTAQQLPVSSTKGVCGHLLGAAGALEAIIAVDSLHADGLPANVGLETPDPEARLNLVRPGEDYARPDVAVSNSYGFGGNNCTLVLRRSA